MAIISEPELIEAAISSVDVYLDGAVVRRSGHFLLRTGVNNVILKGIHTAANERLIRARFEHPDQLDNPPHKTHSLSDIVALTSLKCKLIENDQEARKSLDIVLNISAEKNVEVKLVLEYIVKDAKWEVKGYGCMYTIYRRYTANLIANVLVSQETGEGWEDVVLRTFQMTSPRSWREVQKAPDHGKSGIHDDKSPEHSRSQGSSNDSTDCQQTQKSTTSSDDERTPFCAPLEPVSVYSHSSTVVTTEFVLKAQRWLYALPGLRRVAVPQVYVQNCTEQDLPAAPLVLHDTCVRFKTGYSIDNTVPPNGIFSLALAPEGLEPSITLKHDNDQNPRQTTFTLAHSYAFHTLVTIRYVIPHDIFSRMIALRLHTSGAHPRRITIGDCEPLTEKMKEMCKKVLLDKNGLLEWTVPRDGERKSEYAIEYVFEDTPDSEEEQGDLDWLLK